MTRRWLSEAEQVVLSEVIEVRDPRLRPMMEELLRHHAIPIDAANRLRRAIGDELAITGIDRELGAINDRGIVLDRLIDRVAELSDLHR